MFAVLIFITLGLFLGLSLGMASKVFSVDGDPLVDEIEAMMPGGQCGQCGEAGCRQAAEAMVEGKLPITACPPGGVGLSEAIANALGVDVNTDDIALPLYAAIDESQCSGCQRCFKACPFDAIVGGAKQMHTVLSDICTGCKLCEPVCPQQCITFTESQPMWIWPKPMAA